MYSAKIQYINVLSNCKDTVCPTICPLLSPLKSLYAFLFVSSRGNRREKEGNRERTRGGERIARRSATEKATAHGDLLPAPRCALAARDCRIVKETVGVEHCFRPDGVLGGSCEVAEASYGVWVAACSISNGSDGVSIGADEVSIGSDSVSTASYGVLAGPPTGFRRAPRIVSADKHGPRPLRRCNSVRGDFPFERKGNQRLSSLLDQKWRRPECPLSPTPWRSLKRKTDPGQT
jgi:hypothetical protein